MKSLIFLLSTFCLGLFSTETPKPEIITSSTEDASCLISFTGLRCNEPEGFFTKDAIYFKIRQGEDVREWPSRRFRMGSGSYENLNGAASFSYSNSIIIELWDDDTNDPDDFLGSKVIPCRSNNNGVAKFTEDGAEYVFYYTVN